MASDHTPSVLDFSPRGSPAVVRAALRSIFPPPRRIRGRGSLIGVAEYRVKSWNELNERLYAGSWQPQLGRFRSQYAFRGMQNAAADMSTSLSRLGGPYAQQEGHLLRNFRKYAHLNAVPGDSSWNWLSLAQHHGLPTRLLDWTFSPYVALHFVTHDIERFDTDGVVWAVDYVGAHKLLPPRLRKLLRDERAEVFTDDMLNREADTLPKLDALAKSKPFVVFLQPPSLDDRIVNQFALFSLMSSPRAQMDPWLHAHKHLWHKIVIPAKLKWEVRDKLDQANITERVLFPGLDGLSRWLKRYYSPRPEYTGGGGGKEQQVRPEDADGPDGERADAHEEPRATRGASSPARGGNGTSNGASAGRSNARRSTRSGRKARGTSRGR